MVPLYVLALAGLGALHRFLAGRASRTERKYARAALAAEQLAKAPRPGNGSLDAFQAAKRQYDLGRLVEVRDRTEAKFLAWQARADGVAQTQARLRAWNGRAVPYLLGVSDAALIAVALHYLGLPHPLTPETVSAWVESLRA